jgi:HSP20 family protein
MTQRPHHEVELYKDGDEYRVYVEVPEFSTEELDVRWHDRRLYVTAERSGSDGSGTEVYSREIAVPHDVVTEAITATYEDGVLTVTVPLDDGSGPRGERIEIGN